MSLYTITARAATGVGVKTCVILTTFALEELFVYRSNGISWNACFTPRIDCLLIIIHRTLAIETWYFQLEIRLYEYVVYERHLKFDIYNVCRSGDIISGNQEKHKKKNPMIRYIIIRFFFGLWLIAWIIIRRANCARVFF